MPMSHMVWFRGSAGVEGRGTHTGVAQKPGRSLVSSEGEYQKPEGNRGQETGERSRIAPKYL